MKLTNLLYKLSLATMAIFLNATTFSPLIPVHANTDREQNSLIFQDHFDDGDTTSSSETSGTTWTVVRGNGQVNEINGSYQLGINRGSSLIIANTWTDEASYTLCFDASVIWSEPGRAIVFYVDANNYYSVGLGSEAGIYRKLNGVETQLEADSETLIRLPHSSLASGTFKIYAQNTGSAIVIKADKSGDGVDFDIEITDTDSAAIAKFSHTTIGWLTSNSENNTPWFYADNIQLYAGLVSDVYTPVTYYVDRNNTQANDDNPGTETQPWLTIQKAADSIKAGDTVIVKSGTYPERVTFESGRRGTEGQVVTIKAQPRRSVTMWGFYTKYAHYLRMEGFNIITDSSMTDWTEQNGVFIASDYVEVVDNDFNSIEAAAISGESVGALIQDNYIYKSQMGIVISGSDWLVEGNEVERLYDWGNGDDDYSRFFGDNHIIRGNYYHGTDFDEIGSAHVDCFQTYDNNGETAHNILFENNYCTDFHQGLMAEAAYYHDISGLTFQNNVFAHGRSWGLCVEEVTNVTAVNNIFADIQYHGMGFRDGATGLVENNIFYNAGSVYWASDGGSVTGSHNLIYDSDKTIDQADFINDIVNQDPLFVDTDTDDFHLLEGSPAIDAAMNVGLTVDKDGNVRPQGTGYDIGPYEFTQALTVWGSPRNQMAHITWYVNYTLPSDAVFEISYTGGDGDPESPIPDINKDVREYNLTNLTNGQPYTITVSLLEDGNALLTQTVTVTPAAETIFLPVLMR